MQSNGELLNHANAAVQRTTRTLLKLRQQLDAPCDRHGREHRLILEGAVLDLSRRHDALLSHYQAMLDATPDEMPESWRRFFACYDEYFEALQETKSSLVQ